STVLQWINATPFGETDPQFGIDKSFFVFVLPGLRLIGDTLGMALVLSLIAALVAHYLFGGIRAGEQRGIVLTKTAQWQIGITVAVLVLVHRIDDFAGSAELITATGGIALGEVDGDDRAALPAMAILAIAAVLVALPFVYT
ncbi:UPF0182 family protein, partial [Burkholderia multivorans]